MKSRILLLIGLYTLFGSAQKVDCQTHLVISQVYGGAGCGTVGCSTYKNDYIEIFNPTAAAQSLNGWSVQYAAAAGTSWSVTALPNIMLQPGQYFLIAEAFNTNGISALPTPDATGSIAMSGTAGKVALVNVTTALSIACPSGATIIDFIGYGATANCSETAPSPAPSTTTAAIRTNVCTDINNNSTEFTATAPNPRNSLTPLFTCATGPLVTAKLTDVISIDNYAPGIANPTDEITYKNTIKNTGTGTANGVTLTETTPTNTTLVPGSEVTSALARNDAYTTGFNTTLSSGNVITNDYGLPLVTVTTFGTVASMGMTTPAGSAGTTTAGGTLTVNSNGTFTYTPPIGYSGTDQFKYIATTGVVGLPNDDAIVSITVNPDITFGTALVDPLCNSGTTGSITFTGVSGGSGSGYTYSITGAAGTYFASPIFLNLAAGTYNLAVKDGAGYIKTGIATLTNPPLLSFTHMDVNNICNGGTAGSITFTATGGTGLLTYSITGSAGTYQNSNVYSGLTGGTYNLAVKDANGCIATGTATLTDPAAVTFTFTKTDITCFGLNNGSIVFNTTTGGSSPYTYSITGTGGTFQVSNSFTGLTAGLKSLVAKDANGCNSAVTSSTVVEPAILVVSGTIPNLIYNVAMATATFSKTGGTGSPATPWSATGLPAGVSINTANGQVTGTPTVTGIFMAVITYTDANGCTDTQNANFNVAPNLQNNAYTGVVGNTQLVSNGHSSPSTPFTSDATNILANDSPAGITITAVTNAATTGGGSITIGTDGKFTYSPPNGSTTADSYVYTGTSNGVSATATINFTIANMVWYVNNTYAGANGTANGSSHRPYTTVVAAATASAANQTIYVHEGMGNTTGNALLKTGQTLRGNGNALTIGALSIAAGGKPTLTGMITLANNVTVDGFDMITGTTTALTSSGATGVNVSIGNITTSGATNAVTLTNSTGTVTIAGGTMTGGSGTVFNVSGGSAAITCAAVINQSNATQRLVNIQSITGGTVTLSGNLSSTGTSTGINVSSCTGGTINFSGTTKTLNTPTVTPVTLASNGGTTINFSGGGLAITSSTATGFNATGGATAINVTGTGNVISSTTGTALNVANSNIGASGITFQSISANGSANGITLNNTGNSGGLTVTGTAATDGSGGTIQNITNRGISIITSVNLNLKNMFLNNANMTDASPCGASDNSGCNAGIHLDGVTGVTLDNIEITTTAQNGINIRETSNLSILNSLVTLTGAGGQTEEGGIYALNLSGTSSITNSIFSFPAVRGAVIYNTNKNLTMAISNSQFNDTQTSAVGADGFEMSSFGNSNTTLTITNCTFLNDKTNGVQFITENIATGNVTITGCSVDPGSGVGVPFDIVANGTSSLKYKVINNPSLKGRATNLINCFAMGNSSMEGRINNNIVQSLSGSGTGIRVVAQENNTNHTVEILNNTITGISADYGILVQARVGNPKIDATVTGNNITILGSAAYDIGILSGASNDGSTSTVCAKVANNFTAPVPSGGFPIGNAQLRTGAVLGTLNFNGPGTSNSSYWDGNGNTPTTGSGGVVSSPGLGTVTYNGPVCVLPNN